MPRSLSGGFIDGSGDRRGVLCPGGCLIPVSDDFFFSCKPWIILLLISLDNKCFHSGWKYWLLINVLKEFLSSCTHTHTHLFLYIYINVSSGKRGVNIPSDVTQIKQIVWPKLLLSFIWSVALLFILFAPSHIRICQMNLQNMPEPRFVPVHELCGHIVQGGWFANVLLLVGAVPLIHNKHLGAFYHTQKANKTSKQPVSAVFCSRSSELWHVCQWWDFETTLFTWPWVVVVCCNRVWTLNVFVKTFCGVFICDLVLSIILKKKQHN